MVLSCFERVSAMDQTLMGALNLQAILDYLTYRKRLLMHLCLLNCYPFFPLESSIGVAAVGLKYWVAGARL